MSAYVVDQKTINRIVTRICADNPETIARYYPELAAKSPAHLGQRLLAMNYTAVDYRYQEQSPVELYSHQHEPCTLIQAYKSLRCLLYQCSEGDIPKTPLYEELARYGHELADRIIADLLEYERAEWG